MKKAIAILMTLALLLSCTTALMEEIVGELPAEEPEPSTWDCPACGATGNTGKFCTSCGAPRPAHEPAVKAGDWITFGRYEQDNDKNNGPEPVEWMVLEVKGDKALVISRYGLVKTCFASTSNRQTWENSQIRSKLNGEFYDDAFNDEEKTAILETKVDESFSQHDPNHAAADGRIGKDTTDFIYILSYAEMMKYLPTEKDRTCYVTESVRKTANYSDKKYDDGYTCWYWMRNPAYRNNAGVVDFDGSIDTCYLHHALGVARPCCWVSLSGLGLADPPAPGEDEEAEPEADIPLSVWDTVTFGRYNQDNEPGMEPIEWMIIDMDEETGHSLLLSKHILDQQPYNRTKAPVDWMNCTLRTWLNDVFLKTAFTSAEQEVILLTAVPNGTNQGNPNYPFSGIDTQDKIYVLSYAEFARYMTNDLAPSAPTDYAIFNGVPVSRDMPLVEGRYPGNWWLRTVSQIYGISYYVTGNGNRWDYHVEESKCGVRPCCWVDLDALQNLKRIECNEDGNPSVKTGDIVTFGHYEQDNDLGNGAEPIQWIVLYADDKYDSAWLIACDVLDAHAYHSSWLRINWADSSIRAWLNDDFLNTAFTEEEQRYIILTDVDNSAAQTSPHRPIGSDNTKDMVFLLSHAEVRRFTASYLNLQNCPTDYALARGVHVYKGKFEVDGRYACRWWLRSPGDESNRAAYITNAGFFANYGENVNDKEIGVRPCIRIRLSALEQAQAETEEPAAEENIPAE